MDEYSLEEQRINTILNSYGLETLLEQNDIEDYTAVVLLVRRGLLDLEDYFEDGVGDKELDRHEVY